MGIVTVVTCVYRITSKKSCQFPYELGILFTIPAQANYLDRLPCPLIGFLVVVSHFDS